MEKYVPSQKVNIGVGKDDINDFARKYNLEIENIYDLLNKYTISKVVFYGTSSYWSSITGGYRLSLPHNGNIVFAVYKTISTTESEQVLVGVSMNATNVMLESVTKFDGFMLYAAINEELGITPCDPAVDANAAAIAARDYAREADAIATALTNIYNEAIASGQIVAPAVDPTLTISGAAADAEVTGDILTLNETSRVTPEVTTFFNCNNVLDFWSSTFDSVFATNGIKAIRAHNALVISSIYTQGIYLPLALESGKQYSFVFTFTAGADSNIRLYNGSTQVSPSFVSGNTYTYTIAEGGTYNLRFWFTAGETINIASSSIRIANSVDTLKNSVIDKSYENWVCNQTLETIWNVGKINTDGSVDTQSTDYRYSEVVDLHTSGVYKLANGGYIVELQIYENEDDLGVARPTRKETVNARSWTASYTDFGFVSFTIVYNAVSDIVCDFNVIDEINSKGTQTIENLLIVTQNEIVNSVQKQVIETQIETVAGARFASQYGVLPSNSASENTTNMQALLDGGGTIIVDLPGTYNFSATLMIGSNTSLICFAGVYFVQNNTGGIILNKGALTKEYDTNIHIEGFTFLCGNYTGSSDEYVPGLRGKIAFYYAKNVTIKNIKCLDLNAYIFFIHIARFENVIIDGCEITGLKDGIHVSCGDGLLIRDCITGTHDDGIALNAHDYAESCPELGWIKNVTIERWRNVAAENVTPGSRGILVLGGAWLDWASGNYYMRCDTVVATNGYVYRLIAPVLVDENNNPVTYQSTVEPTHSSGEQTYSDGLTWRCVQHNTVYNCGVENLTIRDSYLDVQHAEVVLFHADNDAISRSVYPNAYAAPNRNITIENIRVNPAAQTTYPVLINITYPCDFIRLINCEFYGYAVVKTQRKSWSTIQNNNKVRIDIIGNRFLNNHDNSASMVLAYLQQDYALVFNTMMNYVIANMTNSIGAGSVSMINDDLTTGNS